jgi:hypothetical protein
VIIDLFFVRFRDREVNFLFSIFIILISLFHIMIMMLNVLNELMYRFVHIHAFIIANATFGSIAHRLIDR